MSVLLFSDFYGLEVMEYLQALGRVVPVDKDLQLTHLFLRDSLEIFVWIYETFDNNF